VGEKELLNGTTRKIIGAALNVHRALGPGKLDSAYNNCYRIDLLVDDALVVEVKAVERVTSVHRAQVRSYPKLSGCKVDLLINFNVTFLTRDGVTRIVNGFPD
jgi:PD-(D/E)XK nuclease superfamily protein